MKRDLAKGWKEDLEMNDEGWEREGGVMRWKRHEKDGKNEVGMR